MTQGAIPKAKRPAPRTKPARAARETVDQQLDALYDRPGFLLRRAHQIAVSLFMEETGDQGITTTQFGAMVLLRARPGIDQATLARMMGFDRSTTGLVVAKLEASGYVTREGNGRRSSTEDFALESGWRDGSPQARRARDERVDALARAFQRDRASTVPRSPGPAGRDLQQRRADAAPARLTRTSPAVIAT